MPSHPFIPCPGVVVTEHHFTSNSKQCMNVYHWKHGTDTTPASLAQLDGLYTALFHWEDSVMSHARNEQTQLDFIRLRNMSAEGDLSIEKADGCPVVGLDDAAALPNNVSPAVTFRTGRGGRSYRGRSYFLGMSITAVDRNKLVPATQAGLVSNYSNLISAVLEATGFVLGVLSLRQDHAWLTTGVFTPITEVTCDLGLDSQRRRLDKPH